MAKFGFDTTDVLPDTGTTGGSYDPIPDGEYTLRLLRLKKKTLLRGQELT